VVEGTPLLRVHPGKTWIQGSNPCVSANTLSKHIRAKRITPHNLCVYAASLYHFC
jgi:hypothetical protein